LRFEGRKGTSDLAGYFPPFKTQTGPKIKKIASDYFSASLLTAKRVRNSVTKTDGPLPVCKNGCGANLKQDFFTVYISCFFVVVKPNGDGHRAPTLEVRKVFQPHSKFYKSNHMRR